MTQRTIILVVSSLLLVVCSGTWGLSRVLEARRQQGIVSQLDGDAVWKWWQVIHLDFILRDDSDIDLLTELPELTVLYCGGPDVTDQTLEEIARLRGLRYLFLSRTRISDEGLPNLQPLRQLRYLYVRETLVTPSGVAQLALTLPECEIHYSDGQMLWPASERAVKEEEIRKFRERIAGEASERD